MSSSSSDIKKGALLLKQGELVALPTETVYGLGADASNIDALHKLYAMKGRPQTHPVIVHLHSLEQVKDWAIELPDAFFTLAERFWPGPLTMIVKRAPGVLDAITGGQNTVGLRMPSHPIAIELLREFGRGVAAPSANKFGRISPTTAAAVQEEFGPDLKMVLDGGACDVGIESTIVDLSDAFGQPRILRPGMIIEENLLQALQKQASSDERYSTESDDAPRVPGALPSHYAPQTRTDLVPSDLLQAAIERYEDKKSLAVISFKPLSIEGLNPSNLIVVEAEPSTYARSLYANLRNLDRLKQSLIIVEEPPQTPEWSGIRDRLLRASSR